MQQINRFICLEVTPLCYSLTLGRIMNKIHKFLLTTTAMSVIKFDSLAPQNCLLKRPPQLVDAALIQLLMCSAWQGPLVESEALLQTRARTAVGRSSLDRFFQNVHRMVHDYDIFKPRLSDNSTECMKYGVCDLPHQLVIEILGF